MSPKKGEKSTKGLRDLMGNSKIIIGPWAKFFLSSQEKAY